MKIGPPALTFQERAFWPFGQHRRIALLNLFFGQGDSFISLYVTIIGAAVIGQGWAAVGLFERRQHTDTPRAPPIPSSADGLSWKRQDSLEHGHTDRKIAVQIEKRAMPLRRSNSHEFSDAQSFDWL